MICCEQRKTFVKLWSFFKLVHIHKIPLKLVERSKLLDEANFLATSLSIFIVETILCLNSEKTNSKHKQLNLNLIFRTAIYHFWSHWYIKTSNSHQATLYHKLTDQQSFLHVHSDHPKSLLKSLPFSHMLRMKSISTPTEYEKCWAILKQQLIERERKENILKNKIDKVDSTDQKDPLRKKIKSYKDRIPCLITYSRKLAVMCKIINKY